MSQMDEPDISASWRTETRPPNLTEKLASVLLMLTDGLGKPVIDRDRAKGMSAEQIVRMFECDHEIHRAIGGTNHPTNLTMRMKAEHREKTAKRDVPQIAKTKRIAAASRREADAQSIDAALSPVAIDPVRKSQWAKQSMATSRDSRFKRTVDGRIVSRETRAKTKRFNPSEE